MVAGAYWVDMRAAIAAPPILPMASSANRCLQYSNPAAEVPHCAALAAVPIHCVNKSETATALNHPKVCMISSRQHKNETLLCRSRQEGVPNRHQLRLTAASEAVDFMLV